MRSLIKYFPRLLVLIVLMTSSKAFAQVTTEFSVPGEIVAFRDPGTVTVSFSLDGNSVYPTIESFSWSVDTNPEHITSSYETSCTIEGQVVGNYYLYYSAMTTEYGEISGTTTFTVVDPNGPAPDNFWVTGNTTTGFTINWTGVQYAVTYRLDVADNNGFAAADIIDLSVSGTSYTVSGLDPGLNYYYRVRSVFETGLSSQNSYVQQTSTLNQAPVANAASSITASSFFASWNNPTANQNFWLDVARDINFTDYVSGYQSLWVNYTPTNKTVTGLAGCTTFHYRVMANSAYNIASPYSNTVTLVTRIATPVALAPNTGAITTTSFTAQWNSVPSVQSYRLDVSDDNFATRLTGYDNRLVNASSTSETVTGLTPGKTYYYRVRAENNTCGGASDNSNPIQIQTIPAAPVANAATGITTTSFTANWSSVSGATSGYKLDVSAASDFSSFVTGYNNLFVSGTSQAVLGLASGTTYYYRVRATNSSGASANSNTITIQTLPVAPTAIAATSVTTVSFTANWNSVTGATSGYKLDLSTASDFSSFVTGYNNLSVSGTSQAVSGLASGTTYYYRVRATNSSGASANSNIITIQTLPVAPAATAATSVTTVSFTANWNSVTGATSGYKLDVSAASDFSSFVTGYNNLSVNGTSQAVSGLASGTTYYYRVRASNNSGASANSNTITIQTLPVAPTATTATSVTTVSFTANWNSVTGATSGYKLDVSAASDFSSFVIGYNNLSVSGTSQAVSGLASGTTYYYRVHAVNNSGPSTISNVISVPTLPDAPTALEPTNITEPHTGPYTNYPYWWDFTMNWTSMAGASSYFVQLSTTNDFSAIYIECTVNATSYTYNTNILMTPPNQMYYYRVRAQNSSGYSTWSNVMDISPFPDVPEATLPTSVTRDSFTANWNPAEFAMTYELQVSKDKDFNTILFAYTLSNSETSKSINGLTEKSPYYYRVRAVNSRGPSSYSNIVLGLNSDENYIKSVDILKEGITSQTQVDATVSGERLINYNFFDGLGRPTQSISMQASPNQKDVVQPFVYDQYGREVVKYLPYASDETDGWLKTNFIDKEDPLYTSASSPQYQFYQTASKVAHDTKPYAVTIYEPSPINRVLEQGASGAAWQPDLTNGYNSTDRTIKKDYDLNAANEVLLWTYTYPTSALPFGLVNASTGATPVYYPPNTIFKNKTKDEQHNEVIEYIDGAGRTILKKVQASATEYTQTYYIYNHLGNLVCVIPPEAVKLIIQSTSEYFGKLDSEKNDFLKIWAFRYVYDNRARMIQKQVPGAEPVYMVYDIRDRLVFAQDGNQRGVNKWSFTKYDELNRPIITGIYTHNVQIDQQGMSGLISPTNLFETYTGEVSNHGYSNIVFTAPNFVTANFEVNTVTYYDAYTFKSLLNSSDFDYKNDELTATGGFKAQDATEFLRTKNQQTGTKVRVLENGAWLWTVNYYDDHNRIIQSTASNFKGGVASGFERSTQVFDFSGNVLRTKTFYSIPGQPDRKITQRFSYDHVGRLLQTWHQIEGGVEILLSEQEYNELGQLVTKNLHKTTQTGTPVTADPSVGQAGVLYNNSITSSSYNSANHTYIATNSIFLEPGFDTGAGNVFDGHIGYSQQDADAYNNQLVWEFKQVIDYRYNIRGWLQKINDPAAPEKDDLFNMEMRYENPTANGGTAQYNGNISEAIWTSAGMDKQSYGYFYDPMNRITKADYFNSIKPVQNGRYTEKIGDGTPSRPGYDLNGNIRNLLRNGKKASGVFGLMDDLSYDYTGGGNKLVSVSDNIAIDTNEEGFKEISEGVLDYTYDDNGNMEKDDNKGITSIEYNYLNLPSKVSKSVTEYITYTYDATGRKLAQQVFGSTAKTTEYVGSLVFENNALQFILHGEGRVIPDVSGGAPDPWEYQYFMKDHLGSTRVVFSEKKNTTEYKATMEDATQTSETSTFRNYNSGVRSSLNLFDHTDEGTTYTYSQLLNGGNASQVGLAKSFEVNPGDVFDLEVHAKYEAPTSTSADPNALVSQLISAFSLGAGTTPLDGSQAQTAFSNLFNGAPWINSTRWEDGSAPKAYLNYILFNEAWQMLDFGFDQISTSAQQSGASPVISHDYLSLHTQVEQKGYLYIYISNENDKIANVYFDDLKIVRHTAVEQISDYYPFGLTFNSSQLGNSIDQNYKFNGKEEQNELGLEWTDYGARMFQADIGRWFVKDPLSELYEGYSPYNYTLNNPVRLIDPNGMAVIETDTSIVYTGKDAVEIFNQFKKNYENNASDDEVQNAFIGAPVLATAGKKAVEEGVKQGVKVTVGGSSLSFGLILSLLTLQGDTGPNYYSPEVAEQKMNQYISEGNLVAAKEYANKYNQRNRDKIVFRYVSLKEGLFLGKTMIIENCDRNLNIVRKFITPDFYPSASQAKSLLALPYAPSLGVWTFQSEIQATKLPRVGWSTVKPNFNEPGGGNEATISQPFRIKGAFILGE